MNKINFFRISLISASLAFAYNSTALAQTNTAKKITLGDLLKKAKEESRGGNATSLQQKSTTALPTAQLGFSNQSNVDLAAVKPPRLSEIYNYKNEDQAAYEKTLDLQIVELYKLTQKFKRSSNRGELWLRLAELYVEKSNIVDARKQDEYDIKLRDFEAGRTRVKPVLNQTVAREYNKRAIQLYEWFLKDFPSDSKIPQALFFLGYNNFELGNIQAGTEYYGQLTSRYPQSQFAGEAHFALGENYFENEKWTDAYKEYAYLIKNSRHNLHTIALYKAAWCLYRLGRTEDGIKYLDYIVKNGRTGVGGESQSGKRVDSIRLENEALKDLVVFFADTGDTKRAVSYFSRINTKESRNCIERLAYYLSDKGNRDGARDTFRYLISLDPNSRKNFEYQYQIVQNYFFSKNSPEFKTELYRWVSGYNSKSAWYAKNSQDQSFINKSNQLREQTLRNYILQQHQTAQNSRAAYSQQSALEGYKLYFQEFPNSLLADNMHFFYAELLYDMGKYSDAATEYSIVVNQYPNSQYAEKASQDILLSLEKALPKEDEMQKRVGNSLNPVSLDENTQKFIKAGAAYLQKYPKSEKAVEIKFRIGRLYYLTNNFDPAEKQFKEIVQTYPNTKYSEYSANLLLDIYNLKKDYAGLEKMGAELLSDQSIANAKLGQDIRGVMEKTSFKQAQDLELSKKFEDSAKQYTSFALQNPKSDLAGIAYFNAGVNFERSNQPKAAMESYSKAVANTSASTDRVRPKAQRLLARLYQDTGYFDEAGKAYQQLAQANSEPSLTSSYWYNSALMDELLNRPDSAVQKYDSYLKNSQDKKDAAEVMFKIAELHRDAGHDVEALASYGKFEAQPEASSEKKLQALYWIANLSKKQNIKIDLASQEVKARALLNNVSDRKKDAAAIYLAKIKIMRSKDIFEQLKSIKIPANPKLQKVAVDRKLEIMNTLNNQLGAIIKLTSSEDIINALDILGESNEHMAESFRSAPVPAKLTGDQRAQYVAGIEKIVEPFVSKSDESYKLAVERARDLQVYNKAYFHSFNKMHIKYPQEFYDSGEASSKIEKLGWIGDK